MDNCTQVTLILKKPLFDPVHIPLLSFALLPRGWFLSPLHQYRPQSPDLVSVPTTLLNVLSGMSPRASSLLNPQTLLNNHPPSFVMAHGYSSAP